MTTLERYGFTAERLAAAGALEEGETFARVVSSHGDYYHVMCNEHEGEALARTKTSAFRDESVTLPTTGDFVRMIYNLSGDSRITAVVPRFSSFERADPSSRGRRREQTIAVNFDALFFMMSANENFSTARLERMQELAKVSGCHNRLKVLITKIDLVTAAERAELVAALEPFGVVPITISSLTGEGMEGLSPYTGCGHTLALVGSSGVGKSSLVNALAGEEWMATQEIQNWSGKGRHTTTSRELVMLPSRLMVIDTPGMRELGIVGRDGGERFFSSGTHRFRV